MDTKDIREQIARELNLIAHDFNTDIVLYDNLPDETQKYGKITWLRFADNCLLRNPDIKEALSLLELFRQGKLVKLADQQILPPVPQLSSFATHYRNGYINAQKDMGFDGFKRVEELETK